MPSELAWALSLIRPAQVVAAVGAQLESSLAEAVGTPCLGISALTGLGAGEVMPTVLRAYETWNQRVPTARLNRWLVQVQKTQNSSHC